MFRYSYYQTIFFVYLAHEIIPLIVRIRIDALFQ